MRSILAAPDIYNISARASEDRNVAKGCAVVLIRRSSHIAERLRVRQYS